jgi:hypothetical protein
VSTTENPTLTAKDAKDSFLYPLEGYAKEGKSKKSTGQLKPGRSGQFHILPAFNFHTFFLVLFFLCVLCVFAVRVGFSLVSDVAATL